MLYDGLNNHRKSRKSRNQSLIIHQKRTALLSNIWGPPQQTTNEPVNRCYTKEHSSSFFVTVNPRGTVVFL